MDNVKQKFWAPSRSFLSALLPLFIHPILQGRKVSWVGAHQWIEKGEACIIATGMDHGSLVKQARTPVRDLIHLTTNTW